MIYRVAADRYSGPRHDRYKQEGGTIYGLIRINIYIHLPLFLRH